MAQRKLLKTQGSLPVSQLSTCQQTESVWTLCLVIASTFYWSM